MSRLSRYALPGRDVRAFYAHLGIALPARADREAAVHCFANPDAHRRADHNPSCSVSMTSGAWCCHACGAHGGSYDTALALGLSPTAAIDLMVTYGLTERRLDRRARRPGRRGVVRTPARAPLPLPAAAVLRVPEAHVREWAQALQDDAALLDRLARTRAWTRDILHRFQIGVDAGRITIPVRQADGRLVALARYSPPGNRRHPKLVMAQGSRRALFPSPNLLRADPVWIVEGHPDALAAHSIGLPAVSIPGAWGWEPRWASTFGHRDVIVCFDSDREGRAAAARVARDLVDSAQSVRILDLAPERDDGYDLTDLVLSAREDARAQLFRLARHPSAQ